MHIKINLFINRVIQALLLFLFVSNLSLAIFEPVLAVFVTRTIVGANLKTVGFAIAIYAIVKSIVQIPLARLIDKGVRERDDFYIMFAGALFGASYLFGLTLARTPLTLYFLSAVNGLGAACIYAAYYSLFSNHVDKGSRGFEWSLFSVWGNTMSVAIGGALGGILADWLGFQSTLIVAGALNIASALLLVFLYPMLKNPRKKVLPLKLSEPLVLPTTPFVKK